jgi:hypothetical protein
LMENHQRNVGNWLNFHFSFNRVETLEENVQKHSRTQA